MLVSCLFDKPAFISFVFSDFTKERYRPKLSLRQISNRLREEVRTERRLQSHHVQKPIRNV